MRARARSSALGKNLGRFRQGNRANRLCCDEAGEVVVVPCGDLSPEAERVLAGGSARQVQRHVFDGGEVGWGVVGSDAAFVIAEDHVHDPVQTVLDGPMASHDHGQAFGWQAQRSDEEPRFPFDRAADLAEAVDDDDALQAGPVGALLQPGDVVDDGGGPGLDAAVIAVDGFVPAAGGLFEAVARLLGHEEFDILAQRALVAFQGEDVIGLLIEDCPGDVTLTADRVNGHDSAFESHQVEQLRNGDDLVGFLRHLDLPEHEALARREGGDHVDGALPLVFWPERREVLPSMAITSAGVPTSEAIQATKQRWNASASTAAKMSYDLRLISSGWLAWATSGSLSRD